MIRSCTHRAARLIGQLATMFGHSLQPCVVPHLGLERLRNAFCLLGATVLCVSPLRASLVRQHHQQDVLLGTPMEAGAA
jgi:hypothetical protein